MKALVVDDDLAVADVLAFTLRRAGYTVVLAHDGQTALALFWAESPGVVVLDLNLPKRNGLDVLREIRQDSQTPVIILSARHEEDDIVHGLKLGADDYIVKPFSPRQLLARIEAVVRRTGKLAAETSMLQAGPLVLDPKRGEVLRDGIPAARLTNLETRLLQTLMENQGRVLEYNYLIEQVWGANGGDRPTLKQLVYRLRKKIEPEGLTSQWIEAISGVGYSFQVR